MGLRQRFKAFAFRRLTPHEFFGIAFWLGFTTTLLIAELWIDYTRESDLRFAQVENAGAQGRAFLA